MAAVFDFELAEESKFDEEDCGEIDLDLAVRRVEFTFFSIFLPLLRRFNACSQTISSQQPFTLKFNSR